jgi:transcription antitermination factor NusG
VCYGAGQQLHQGKNVMKKQIKIDDARDMVLKLDLDQANNLLGFLQFHRDAMQSMADSDIQIGDKVKTINGNFGKDGGTVVDIDNRWVTFSPNARNFDKRIALRKVSACFVRKVA